jgi:hypothetical protein
LVLHVLPWFCSLSFSVFRISWRVFCSCGLVAIYCCSFCLLFKTFIAPSILNHSFAGWSILGLKLFSFTARMTSVHALPPFKVSVEKSAVTLMAFPLYVIWFFCLTAFSILSLFSVLVVLIIRRRVVLFW